MSANIRARGNATTANARNWLPDCTIPLVGYKVSALLEFLNAMGNHVRHVDIAAAIYDKVKGTVLGVWTSINKNECGPGYRVVDLPGYLTLQRADRLTTWQVGMWLDSRGRPVYS